MAGSSRKSTIDVANEEVSIYSVCDIVGIDYSSYYGNTAKLYCPFGHITHMDGGQTRAFRIYPDTNSAYCFACSQYFDSVGLFAAFSDMTREESAVTLLEGIGWQEETFEEKWERLTEEVRYDTSEVVTALNAYCERKDPMWPVNSMYSPYLESYTQCIGLVSSITNHSQAAAWLSAAKKHMNGVLP
jgi:hypothetical protein